MGMAFGVAVGLVAAFLQSCSYLASGRYVRVSGLPTWTLAIASGPAFAVLGGLTLLFCWPARPETVPWTRLLWIAAFVFVSSMIASWSQFAMQKWVDSSRASPLMALKIPVLAFLYAFILGEPTGLLQWIGVAFVVVSAILLVGSGRRIPPVAFGALACTCVGYAASDHGVGLFLGAAVPIFDGAVLRGSFFALGGIYLFIGTVCTLVLPFIPRARRAPQRLVLPYVFTWFAAMVVLYLCFASCGIVLGTIAQNMRGIFSVVLGWFIARAGFRELEEPVSRAVFIRRVAAALLMAASVALYAYGKTLVG